MVSDNLRFVVILVQNKPKKLMQRSMFLSLGVGSVLFIVKFSAYIITNSAAILSDALESIVHIIPTIIAVYSMHISLKPPDEKHQYGHGKIEFLSAGIEGGAITIVAFWIIYKSLHELFFHSIELNELNFGLLLIIIAAFVNLLLGYFLVRTGEKSKSLILVADGKHILSDVFTSVGVIVGLIITSVTGWYILDPIIAITVSIFIIRTGYVLLKQSFLGIMDTTNPSDNLIITKILDQKIGTQICGYHKLRHRLSGGIHYIDFHLIVPREMRIDDAHRIATEIESEIAEILLNAGVMAHIEPCKDPNCSRCFKKEVL